MARVTVDGKQYDYDPNKMLNTEAIALQKVTGMRLQEWASALKEGDALALTGLVWLLWRRAGDGVPFGEVVFDIGSLDLEEDEELAPEASEEPVGPTAPEEATRAQEAPLVAEEVPI